MRKGNLGLWTLKWCSIGQIVVILLAILLVKFADYPAKETTYYVIFASVAYWTVFGPLAYMSRNYYKKR